MPREISVTPVVDVAEVAHVDTLETAVPWSRIESAHAGIVKALEASLETGLRGVVGGVAAGLRAHPSATRSSAPGSR